MVLSDATFNEKFDFKRSKVNRGRIQRTTFSAPVNFESAGLGHSSFHQSKFEKETDFSRSSYYGDGTFSETTFLVGAKFLLSKFKGNAVFKNSKWDGKADLKNIAHRAGKL